MNLKIGILTLLVGLVTMSMNTDYEASKGVIGQLYASTNDNDSIILYESFEDFEPLLQKNNDTTYIINFWATWCKPCVAELPVFEELHSKGQDEKIKVILCSLDFPNALEKSLYPFVEKWNLQSQVVVLLDGKFNRWVDKISPDWSGAIPATYVYKNNQKIFVEKSFESVEEIEILIKKVN